MSLNLKCLFEGVLEYLNGARLVILSDTSKEVSTTVHHHKLRDVHTSLKSHSFLAFFDFLYGLVSAHSVESGF